MNSSPWAWRDVISLRTAAERVADGDLKQAIQRLLSVFDAETTECVLTGNFNSVVFKNPTLKCLTSDNTPCTVNTKIVVELCSKGTSLYEIVDYRHPQGCSTYENGAAIDLVVKRLQTMCWNSRNRQ